MRIFLSKLHLWLSIPVGLIISVICFTGAIMVLDKDIHRWMNPSFYTLTVTEQHTEPMPIDSLVSNLSKQLDRAVVIRSISLENDPTASLQISLVDDRATYYVHPYTGEVLGERTRFAKGSFYRTLFYTHRWLMMTDKWAGISPGKLITGVSTLILVAILISGIFIWLPRARKNLGKSLQIHTTKGWRRFNYDLHVAGGAYISVGLLVLALTGLMWSFQWYRAGVFTLFGAKTEISKKHDKVNNTTVETPNYTAWNNALSALRMQHPKAVYYSVNNKEIRRYYNQYGNTSAYDTYLFDKETGTLTETIPYANKPKSSQVMAWAYTLHIGAWGGFVGRIITCFISLMGGILPLTGYYLWIKKRRRRGIKRM
jgi:uncharacterized iron-regulated membrane protein